jgi:hypothetical protein
MVCLLAAAAACAPGDSPDAPAQDVDDGVAAVGTTHADTLAGADTSPTGPDSAPSLVVPGGRFGPIGPDASARDLAAAVGGAYADTVAYLGEGFCGAGAVLYAGTPDEIRVAFVDDSRELVASAVAEGEGARWRTAEGIGVGTPLERVAELNGAPITFTGFGWDRGGTVIGYGGGALARYRDGTGFFVLLDATPRVTERALVGDHDVSSDHPALAAYDVRVRGLEAQWRTPQAQDCAPRTDDAAPGGSRG